MSEPHPKVVVIVTHHLNENDKYLALTLKTLNWNTYNFEFQTIVMSDAPNKPEVHDTQTLHWVPNGEEINSATKKSAYALKHLAKEGWEYVIFISDDVFIADNTIQKLVNGCPGQNFISNPYCNSDLGSQFFGQFAWNLPTKFDMSVVENDIRTLTNTWQAPITLFRVPWVAFYCTMIPRRIWDAVGGLDEELDVRHNDQDFCIRASALGFPAMINLGAIAYHFGDRTLPRCTTELEYNKATDHFKNKWSL